MGGSIAVTIRTPDGEWHKMDRWTNATSYTFTDPLFMDGDQETLDNYLKPWYEMCEEFDNGTFEEKSPMAAVYCNHEYSSRDKTMPSEYGLVFIDFVNKLFINMNGYTTYDSISDAKVKMLARTISFDQWDRDFLNRVAPRIREYAELDRKNSKKGNLKWNVTPVIFANADDLIAHSETIDINAFSEYRLDMGDWKYIELADDNVSSLKFMQALLGDGYELTEEEQEGFRHFRNFEDEE